ncbi:MAG: glutamate 5-kinase [Pseudomonadota bacterium]
MTTAPDAAALLDAAASIVIKVGSALLVDDAHTLRRDWLGTLCADIARLQVRGARVTVVSSGAVALGAQDVGQPRGASALAIKQAAAAAGQVALAQAWRSALSDAGCGSAQVLLTPQDTEHRRRHLNARATLDALAAARIVPVINENDTVATEELRYGDNDRLAARVAQMIGADLLVLLSDVDGLYAADPATHPDAAHIAHVTDIDDAIDAIAGESSSAHGTGGMRSKIAAARLATGAGAAVVIASGREPTPIGVLAKGARATSFDAATTVPDARRRWIRASLRQAAAVIVDAGAASALAQGASLLPVGVVDIEGDFERGDCIAIRGQSNNAELGIGLAGLDSVAARDAMAAAKDGARTVPLVHRDDLVLENPKTHE